MSKRIVGTTPKVDGFRMPGEFEKQEQIWMLWPWRNDNWRLGAKPAQKAFLDVAKAISEFEPVSLCVPPLQFENAIARVSALDCENIRVIEMTNDDSWIRDCGPTFLINDKGERRAVDWEFNAWGGLVDGLYFPWDQDALVARKVCELTDTDSYKTEDFVLEGGSIHVDGEGTVMVTEMCLLHPSRNPHLSKEEIEQKLKVHKMCVTKKPCYLKDADTIDYSEGAIPREEGEVAIASYLNFLIVNGGIILPQYGDENDALAVEQVQAMFPDRKVVGVETTEIAYGGGNIHCITQQQPATK